jgi:hypothetical protein
MEIRKIFCLVVIIIFLAGCGVSNIVNRGEYITEKSVSVGTPRTVLLSRFGAPISTKKDGEEIISDIFRVPQGETTTGKVLKGGGLLALDVITFGLAEAVATGVTRGNNYITFEVQYDKDQTATQFKIITR